MRIASQFESTNAVKGFTSSFEAKKAGLLYAEIAIFPEAN